MYHERELTGFGLVLQEEESRCFSWEWFDRRTGDVFHKLQGAGRVKITTSAATKGQELVAIQFLDDVTLRCSDHETGQSREVHVKPGSALRVKP